MLATMASGAAPAMQITRFHPALQPTVRELVVTGLGEHWGEIDAALNPDLDEIAAWYAKDVFLVAWIDGEVVGAGALVERNNGVGEIVRMSVRSDHRRRGVGARLVDALIAAARAAGFERVVLETTAAWDDVRAFYEACGFRCTHEADGDFGRDAYYQRVVD